MAPTPSFPGTASPIWHGGQVPQELRWTGRISRDTALRVNDQLGEAAATLGLPAERVGVA
jgi:hypothetical protein